MRRLFRYLALAGLIVLLLEAGLRVAGFSFSNFTAPNDQLGWTLRPGYRNWSPARKGVYIDINSEGFRDKEHFKHKAAGTFRIALLGGSYVEALQVPIQDTFWSVMERNLQSQLPEIKPEVLAFGVSGYSTAQNLLVLRQQVRKYEPDMVVVAFQPTAEIAGNSRALAGERDRPYFVYEGDRLVFNRSFRESASHRLRQSRVWRLYYRLLDHSRTLQLLRSAKTFVRQQRVRAQLRGTTSEPAGGDLGLAEMAYRRPVNQEWEEAWHVTEGLLTMMRDEAAAMGASFVVVTVTRGVQVHPDPVVRARYMRTAAVEDLFYPSARISTLSEREGFPAIALAREFQSYAAANRIFLHGFAPHPGVGEWNENGHQLAARILTREILKQIPLRRRSLQVTSAIPASPSSRSRAASE
jgi:hypothetical protein